MSHSGLCRCFVRCLVVVMTLGAVLGAAKGQEVPSNMRAETLALFLRDVQDPQSASYKHWLTPSEFTAKFGAAGAPKSAVVRLHPMTLVSEKAGVMVAHDGVAALAALVQSNSDRLIQVSSAACVDDFDEAAQVTLRSVLEQAAAQGITVLAASGCAKPGVSGFPSVLGSVTAVALSPGIYASTAAELTELRPQWQVALGLPVDGARHEPDVTVSSLAALAATMEKILAREPVSADGSPARLGNIAGELYRLAQMPGLYTQPGTSGKTGAALGTWEATTGLGVVDLGALDKFYPEGALANNVSIQLSSGYVAHGSAITFRRR